MTVDHGPSSLAREVAGRHRVIGRAVGYGAAAEEKWLPIWNRAVVNHAGPFQRGDRLECTDDVFC